MRLAAAFILFRFPAGASLQTQYALGARLGAKVFEAKLACPQSRLALDSRLVLADLDNARLVVADQCRGLFLRDNRSRQSCSVTHHAAVLYDRETRRPRTCR